MDYIALRIHVQFSLDTNEQINESEKFKNNLITTNLLRNYYKLPIISDTKLMNIEANYLEVIIAHSPET